jgi:hypothetical protein
MFPLIPVVDDASSKSDFTRFANHSSPLVDIEAWLEPISASSMIDDVVDEELDFR